ncbi:MAG: hypothetical protein KAG95_02520 [Bacteroidales bacterium]|nr:hypothetical protein [Bacteroidales bacterium]
MKIRLLFLILFIIIFSVSLAQTQKSEEKKEFKPSGSPFIRVFSNFHADMTKNNESSAFELTRAYFGYKCNMSENFSAKLTFDVGNPKSSSSLKMTAFIKTAALTYNNNKGNLTFNFGIICLNGYNLQRKYWDHRYIYKTIQNQNKFGYTADMGAGISYKINKLLSLDATVMNGEGYKNIQIDNTYKSGLGITISPTKNLVIREYVDLSAKSEAQYTISNFVGYKLKNHLTLGVEYVFQSNHNFVSNNNLSGFSVFVSYNINKNFQIFGRSDNLSSNKISDNLTAWNIAKDGKTIIGGVQYSPIKNVKIAANYQFRKPELSSLNNEPKIYLNFEYKF